MREGTKPGPRMIVGFDLGDRLSHAFALDAESGAVAAQFAVSTSPEEFEIRFRALPHARVVIEAGATSRWVSQLLRRLGHEVLVANARQLALISASLRKTDRSDAETLARLGRSEPGLLRCVTHRSERAQEALEVLKARDIVVSSRTKAINHVRGVLKSCGVRVGRTTSGAFAGKADPLVPEGLRRALRPLLREIARQTKRIRAYDRRIEAIGEEEFPATARLRQVAGVGPVTSLAFVLTLDRHERFAKSRDVGAFLGLCPRTSQSGDSDPQLGISKAGNAMLRRLLVQSAHYILGRNGPDTSLRRFGLSIAARGAGNSKKRAVVAVARRLAVLLHRLWASGEKYEPLRGEPASAAGAA
jgi:transposase